MAGIGELFGSSFDEVLRRPIPALVPLALDLATLAVVALLVGPLGAPASSPPLSPPISVPTALPTSADVVPALGAIDHLAAAPLLFVVAAVLVLLPIAAYVEAGFLGVLLDAYLPRRAEPLTSVEPKSARDLLTTFERSARTHFGAIFVLRAATAAFRFGAVLLFLRTPFLKNDLLGILAFDFILLYAPYVAVVEGKNALEAARWSFRHVADALATTLVALLFGLLTTGGLEALLAPILARVGLLAWPLAAALYAPVGCALSLFYLKVYLSLVPNERLPSVAEKAPATMAAEA
ncbi:MAG: hypothetical protein ACYDCK_11525 [Thermoplasmatota archaeon]